MSKRKSRLALNSGVYPSRHVPYGHKGLTRRQTHAIRVEQEVRLLLREHPSQEKARGPVIRRKGEVVCRPTVEEPKADERQIQEYQAREELRHWIEAYPQRMTTPVENIWKMRHELDDLWRRMSIATKKEVLRLFKYGGTPMWQLRRLRGA